MAVSLMRMPGSRRAKSSARTSTELRGRFGGNAKLKPAGGGGRRWPPPTGGGRRLAPTAPPPPSPSTPSSSLCSVITLPPTRSPMPPRVGGGAIAGCCWSAGAARTFRRSKGGNRTSCHPSPRSPSAAVLPPVSSAPIPSDWVRAMRGRFFRRCRSSVTGCHARRVGFTAESSMA